MTVYIAGKMTGLPDLGRQAFNDAEKRLIDAGYDVINPAILPRFLSREQCIPICLAMIDAADVVFALENWEDSPGARLEVEYAKVRRKIIKYRVQPEPSSSLIDKTTWRDASKSPPGKGAEVIVSVEDSTGDGCPLRYSTHGTYLGNHEWFIDNEIISDDFCWGVVAWRPYPDPAEKSKA